MMISGGGIYLGRVQGRMLVCCHKSFLGICRQLAQLPQMRVKFHNPTVSDRPSGGYTARQIETAHTNLKVGAIIKAGNPPVWEGTLEELRGGCHHDPDYTTTRESELAGVNDVWCRKCGISGSYHVAGAKLPDDILWE